MTLHLSRRLLLGSMAPLAAPARPSSQPIAACAWSSRARRPQSPESTISASGPKRLTWRPAPPPFPNQVPGRVLDVALLGVVRQVTVQLPGGRTVLTIQRNEAGSAWSPGQPVHLRFAPEACRLVPSDPS